ncbi:MAG: sigma-70 family RNA polymerase sigma factor [Anaerolineales bacterium]|nr:sigma-70 family RNA polymerase sigma factor [Anaerolineales bacterium]MCW5855025.1 sigma-70 family RNA polymerase sigma factor [Anaerolineales bacterium]
MPELSDEKLLAKATAGDKQAFGMLYDKYATRIYNYIYYRTGSAQDAEDLTSRVFFRAMRHITNYRDRGVPFTAWLYRIAHNLVANWHRDSSRRQEVELEDGYRASKGDEHPEQALMESEDQNALLSIIRKLPEERQQLLILKFVEHMSNAEIGQIMDRTEGAIKSLYHRTLLSLREAITKDKSGHFLLDMFRDLPED